MAYPCEFVRVRFLFQSLGSPEIAETGFTLGPNLVGTLATDILAQLTDEILTGFASALNDMLTGDEIRWANYSRLAAVKASAHLTSGVQTGAARTVDLASPFTGDAAQVHPQNTVLISLWSGFMTGPGNYARMYLPHTQVDLVGSTPIGDPVDASFNSAHAAVFIGAVDAVTDPLTFGSNVCIASQAFPDPGVLNRVTNVRVGVVTDTQRRRYDQLSPGYVTTVV